MVPGNRVPLHGLEQGFIVLRSPGIAYTYPGEEVQATSIAGATQCSWRSPCFSAVAATAPASGVILSHRHVACMVAAIWLLSEPAPPHGGVSMAASCISSTGGGLQDTKDRAQEGRTLVENKPRVFGTGGFRWVRVPNPPGGRSSLKASVSGGCFRMDPPRASVPLVGGRCEPHSYQTKAQPRWPICTENH